MTLLPLFDRPDCPSIRSGRHCFEFGIYERCSCPDGGPCHFCGYQAGGESVSGSESAV